ncbi:MAG TPA: DnaB-like helicase C-terminal domain-containing protein [Acidocella sp.]|jgi:replicative DNA helicase|uniref:replicative DNA helicase n=1 Tax=Acidocella sp. TaxID=50710 RepID=UPI002C3B5FA8|nr:DnaB-like helicase C-terminal domain-containing protein [Acidocella sp.]HVE20638.1 DnaB-like helicase C-terminal domain-containing protein [Acidocella sp.]
MSDVFNVMRIPPSNVPAEQALLGALLANNKAFESVAEFLLPHHFADPANARVYGAIASRIAAGQVADPVTLKAEFEHAAELDAVGGLSYLGKLLASMIGIINAGDYGRAVHDAWLRRELIAACTEAINQAYVPTGVSGQEVLEELDGALTRVADGAGEVKPLSTAGDAVSRAVVLSTEAGERDSALAGLTTGYAALDRLTAGLMPGQMYLLGARPAMGKTGLGLGIAARAASHGAKVLMWSGEMDAPQLGTRLAAAHSGIEVASVFRGKGWEMPPDHGGRPVSRKLTMDEGNRLVRAGRDAYRLPLNFDDRPGLTVAGLRARARRMKRGKGLDLIVVDYIALMRATAAAEKQKLYERMTELSRDLRILAAELHVPILVLAQLNRANESRENKMPQLSDLRDTGALEQDAYCVMFLHRPHYYLMQAGEPVRAQKESAEAFQERSDLWHHQVESTRGLALVSIAKNRNGPTGICRLRFDAETIWFRDESEADNEAAWGSAFLGDA